MTDHKHISTYRIELRDRILTTAMNAFMKKGIKAVKMDDIAQQLSISKRTLYELFENKEVLFLEGMRKYKSEKEDIIKKTYAKSKNVMDMLLKVYKMQIETFNKTHPLLFSDLQRYPNVLNELKANRQEDHRRFVYFLNQGKEQGFFRPDIDPTHVAMTHENLSHFVMDKELYKQYSIEEIYRNIIFVSLRGICTPSGVAALDASLADSSSL